MPATQLHAKLNAELAENDAASRTNCPHFAPVPKSKNEGICGTHFSGLAV